MFRRVMGATGRMLVRAARDDDETPKSLGGGYRTLLGMAPRMFSVPNAELLPAVPAAVNRIAGRVAALPMTVTEDGEPVDDDEARMVTSRWRSHLPANEGVRYWMRSILLHGYGGVRVERAGSRLVGLTPLDPLCLHRYRIGGEVKYYYTDTTGRRVDVLRDDLLFMPFVIPDDGYTDRSPLAASWPAVRAGIAAVGYSAEYLQSGASPAQVWKAPRGLAGNLQTEIDLVHEQEDLMRDSGRRSMVAPPGWEVVFSGASAKDADLTAMRRDAVEEVARIYGLPPIAVQELSRSTYSNYAAAMRAEAETLVEWADRAAAEMTNILYPLGGRTVSFETKMLGRPPLGERLRGYRTGIASGVMSRNQAREMEGWVPSPQEGMDGYDLTALGGGLAPVIGGQDPEEFAAMVAAAMQTGGDE